MFSLLAGGQDDSKDIFLDFENAQPTPEEKSVFDDVNKVLEKSDDVLEDLKNYSGASEAIRDAIGNPRNNDKQDFAWNIVLPLVEKLKTYYEYSIELETIMPTLLCALCTGNENLEQRLSTKQALAKQFAEILHFTLKFDDLKMTNPNIQNDFSYYRRTLSRKRMASGEDGIQDTGTVSTEMANRMSLFYAYPTPLLKSISEATTKFVSSNSSFSEITTQIFSTLSNLCRAMIENVELAHKFHNEEKTKTFVLNVMVGVIILYDHVHDVGAFAKNSEIDMKATIKVLKDQELGSVDGLLNALRYTTKHLNDETTPKQIRLLLS